MEHGNRRFLNLYREDEFFILGEHDSEGNKDGRIVAITPGNNIQLLRYKAN